MLAGSVILSTESFSISGSAMRNPETICELPFPENSRQFFWIPPPITKGRCPSELVHLAPAASSAATDSERSLPRMLPFPEISISSPLPDKYAARGISSLVRSPLSPANMDVMPLKEAIPPLFIVSVLPSTDTSAPRDFTTSTAPRMSLQGSKFSSTVVPWANAAPSMALCATLLEQGIVTLGLLLLKMVPSLKNARKG